MGAPGEQGVERRRARTLGFWSCLALVVGNMIGSGIFLLPGRLAPFGWNAVFGWAITMAGGVCLAYVFARLARALPRAGGPYAYVREAFGPLIGFLVAWGYWITLWVGNAAIAVAGARFITLFAPGAADAGGPALIAVAIVWLLTAINIIGVRAAMWVQIVTTALKLLPLLAVVVIGIALLLHGQGGETLPQLRRMDLDPAAMTAVAGLTFWVLMGLESATIPADHVRRPNLVIPLATIAGAVIAGSLYVLVCSAVAMLSPPGEAAASSMPIADFIASAWGGEAGLLVAPFAAIAAFGALNGWILLQGELAAAMARDGVFPRWLGVRTARDTPARAHIVSSLLLTIVLLLNSARDTIDLFAFVALLATATGLFAYLLCALAAIRLLPGVATFVIAAGAGGYSAWVLWAVGREAVGWGLVLLAIGLPLYVLVRRDHAKSMEN